MGSQSRLVENRASGKCGHASTVVGANGREAHISFLTTRCGELGVPLFGTVAVGGYTRRMLLTLPLLLLLIADTGQSEGAVVSPNGGSVNGTVTNEEGKAVAGATVYAFPLYGGMAYKVPRAETNETGHFAIHGLQWGLYSMSAKKEEDDFGACEN